MIRLPSYVSDFDVILSTDDAVVQPAPDASQADKDEHARKLRVARQTGDYAPVLVEGKVPTRFVCRIVDDEKLRRIIDRVNVTGPDRIGTAEMLALMVKLSLKDVANCAGLKVEKATDETWGRVVGPATMQALGRDIVSELGGIIWERSQTLCDSGAAALAVAPGSAPAQPDGGRPHDGLQRLPEPLRGRPATADGVRVRGAP
jgi:hypothetical protein